METNMSAIHLKFQTELKFNMAAWQIRHSQHFCVFGFGGGGR